MLTLRQERYLAKIAKLVEAIKVEAHKPAKLVRMRRSRAEAAKMRREVLLALSKGVSPATLAKKYGVSPEYIYMIKK